MGVGERFIKGKLGWKWAADVRRKWIYTPVYEEVCRRRRYRYLLIVFKKCNLLLPFAPFFTFRRDIYLCWLERGEILAVRLQKLVEYLCKQVRMVCDLWKIFRYKMRKLADSSWFVLYYSIVEKRTAEIRTNRS